MVLCICIRPTAFWTGEGTVEKVLDRAKELGQEAMAITDHGNMYGVIEFYEYAKKIGVKAYFGL